MRSGRCVSGHHGVIGCAVDVLTFFDRKCSGRTHCAVYVADPALQKLEPCSKDFTSYLEAKYTCLSGKSPCCSVLIFYPRDAMHSAVFATATCLSVCHSRYCVSQSESRIVKCTPSDIYFWQSMTRRKIRKGSPPRNVPNENVFILFFFCFCLPVLVNKDFHIGFLGDFRPICRHISKRCTLDTKLL